MAYRRCIVTRTKQLYQQQRFAPSFSYTINEDDSNNNALQSPNYSIPSRAFGTFGAFTGSNVKFRGQRFGFAPPPLSRGAFGGVFGRNMSTSVGSEAVGSEGLRTDIDAFVDGTLEAVTQVAPVLNEVTVAAADSFFPIAALQHIINHIHIATGLNWWSSIVLSTLVIRCLLIPLNVFQLRASAKFSLLKPKLEEIQAEMQAQGMSQEAASEGRTKMAALFKEYGVTPYTPMKGILITAPVFISFFLAIQNMAEKVPSFQQGGAYWFVDLTTPDPLYIFPVLTALTFWITVEFNTPEGMEGTTSTKTMKNVSRVFAALSVPLTASFAKAIFCYWITANSFSLAYGLLVKRPEVKKFLNIPTVPHTPPSPASQDNSKFSFFDAVKKFQIAAKQNAEKLAAQRQSLPASSSAEASKGVNQKIPASTILSHRVKSLEKELKGRKKRGKKRS